MDPQDWLYADVQRAKAELRQANDELEQRVDERTRELKQAQARLVDTARAVGMSEVATGMSCRPSWPEGPAAATCPTEHIRAIVQVQQTYAKTSLMPEECDLSQLIQDALRIQTAALQRHGVTVRRELGPVPRLKVDKHKVLQILINLISNAKYALDAVPEGERHLSVKMVAEGNRVRILVVDNGMGISAEARERLFVHGFTTRKDGHGFGLHSSALAAQLLEGRLT